jgi:hypothetical protein
MAVTLNENSYVTLEEAEAFYLQRLGSDAWTDASASDREAALVTATTLLDNMRWNGVAVSSSQTLCFPRTIEYFDTRLGYTVNVTGVPKRVKDAQLELTLHLLENPGILQASTSIESIKVGPINLDEIKKVSVWPPRLYAMVQPLLINSGANLVWRAN